MMVLRLILNLSRSGLLSGGVGGIGETGSSGTGGGGGIMSGGILSSGRGAPSRTGTFLRTGAVGGGGNQGSGAECDGSSSDEESPSNRFSSRLAMAMVPRLRPLRSTLGGFGGAAPPRPDPHSRSLGASEELGLSRRHRQTAVMAEKAKRMHRAMLRPQMALTS
jgi:hypothetical protein